MSTNTGKKFRVLVADPLDVSGLEILKSFSDVDVKIKQSEDQLVAIIGNYDALVVRSATRVTARVIEAGAKLCIIGRAGVGVDNVDVRAATSRGIFVVNSPQGNTVAAAEHTLALMLSLSRHIAAGDASLRSGQWAREKFMGTELQHKTLGIVGLGQVGSHVARIAREIGMNLLTYDPYVNAKKAEALGCRVMTLNDLLRESDFITLHVPLMPQTKYLINAETLQMMKPTARLINCSRGGVVEESALCEALTKGRLAGAALDVFEVEGKMSLDHCLLNTPNLVLTPHLGASTLEAQINVAIDVAQQLKQALEGDLPTSAVNIPGLRVAELSNLRPLIECCEILGRLAVQLLREPLETISVTAEGEFANLERGEALLLSAANGALSVHSSTRVNFVNVRAIADQLKIKLLFIRDPQVKKSGVSVEVGNGEKKRLIRGTVTEDNDVLLKAFDNVAVYMVLPSMSNRKEETDTFTSSQLSTENALSTDIPLTYCDVLDNGHAMPVQFVYSRHDDLPGTLAQIATALGDAGINIANCHIGRNKRRSTTEINPASALAVFHVDGTVSSHMLDRVRKLPAVRDCTVFTL